jgi:hypothetical protein
MGEDGPSDGDEFEESQLRIDKNRAEQKRQMGSDFNEVEI